MMASDLFLIGLTAILGTSILAHSVANAHKTGVFRGVPERYRSLHERLTGRLIRQGLLRIPGIRLVNPLRPWAVSETVFLAVAIAGCFVDRTFAGVSRSIGVASLLGMGVLWFRFRDDAREAIRSVRRDLPVACFLLSLLLESGMGASSALQEAASSLPRGALSRELGKLVRARSMGIPRNSAISSSRDNLPLEEYHLFLNYVSQGERLGIGLSRSLRELSSKMLESMGHRAETVAQQAAVKMLFPLVFFIFPAVFLLILSPVLLGLQEMLWG